MFHCGASHSILSQTTVKSFTVLTVKMLRLEQLNMCVCVCVCVCVRVSVLPLLLAPCVTTPEVLLQGRLPPVIFTQGNSKKAPK